MTHRSMLTQEERERTPGFYYVHVNGEWGVAYWFVRGGTAGWDLIGRQDEFSDHVFDFIGLRVPLPTAPPPPILQG